MPFVAVIAVITTSGMLLFAMYFTEFNLQWVTFLSGILAASLLAMVVRATHAEFSAARRLARLSILQERLSREKKRRDELEKLFGGLKARLHFSDEALPLMVAYVDAQTRYQYHNRAFGEWLGLRKDKIDGHHMRDVHGRKGFAEIEVAVAKAMEGEFVRSEWTPKMPGGVTYRLSSEYLPRFGDKRNVEGFYMVITDLTERKDVQGMVNESGPQHSGVATQQSLPEPRVANADSTSGSMQEMFVESLSQEATGWKDAVDRITAAIKKGEFSLFYQPIRPLAPTGGLADHYEIFIRLLEEESNLIPPGAFFPLAEEHGLLPQLDRWVVEHLLAWMSSRKAAGAVKRGEIFFINVAIDTLCDRDFPDFIEYQLRKNAVSGSEVCFEITENGLNARRGEVEHFVRLVKQSGCRIALTGFGRERVAVDLLKKLPLDFLKIDGSVILGIQRNAVDLAKLIGINRISKVIGVSTIAEMVETKETMAKLREIKIDFAQGFGIANPQPLSTLGV